MKYAMYYVIVLCAGTLCGSMAISSVALAGPSVAETKRIGGDKASAEAAGITVSNSEIQEFMALQQKLGAIRQAFESEVASVGNNQEKASVLIAKLDKDVTSLIDRSVLSMERFEEIAISLRTNPALRQHYGIVIEENSAQ